MPAEHLTKKRLIQLLIMMVILLTAFFYRTFYPVKSTTNITEKAVATAVSKTTK